MFLTNLNQYTKRCILCSLMTICIMTPQHAYNSEKSTVFISTSRSNILPVVGDVVEVVEVTVVVDSVPPRNNQ